MRPLRPHRCPAAARPVDGAVADAAPAQPLSADGLPSCGLIRSDPLRPQKRRRSPLRGCGGAASARRAG
ncbi:MAG: hypothetical protein LBE67_10010 [Kocuria palustris]|nr:hypothetical protein [Kocuria palustris]